VRQVGVDQGDLGFAALAQGSTQAGGKLQAAGAAADDSLFFFRRPPVLWQARICRGN
jgi:hypothetical protein